jgi:hypothetical protein
MVFGFSPAGPAESPGPAAEAHFVRQWSDFPSIWTARFSLSFKAAEAAPPPVALANRRLE